MGLNDYAFRAAKTTATATLLLGVYVSFAIQPTYLEAANWNKGDVFLGVSTRTYQVRAPDGTLKESLTKGEGFTTTGCAFDSDGNLYTTNFDFDGSITKYDGADPHAASLFGSGYSAPESIVFDAFGQVYVGNLGNGIRQFDENGVF